MRLTELSSRRLRATALAALGLGMAATWALACTRPWWLWDHYPAADLRPVLASAKELAAYGAVVPVLFALYAAAAWLAGRGASRWLDAVALAMPLLFVALLLPTLPATSSDVHHYVMEGRVLWVHGGNPLVDTPAEYPQDPYLHYVPPWHQGVPAPYGPAWALLTGLPSLLPQGRPEAVLLGYKALASLFLLGTGGVLWAALGPMGPEARRRGLVLFAWNPLLVISAAVDGHNDTAMMFFAVVAVAASLRERWSVAFPALIVAALVKYVAVLLAPLLLAYAWLRGAPGRRREAVLAAVLAVVLGIGLLAPFWEGMDTFRALRIDQRSWFANSLAEVALLGLAKVLPLEQSMQAARALAASAFLAPYLLLLLRPGMQGEGLVWSCYQSMFLYLTVGSTLFYPWYVAWVLPLAALLGGSRWAAPALLLSFTACFVALVERMVFHLGFLRGDTGMQALVTVAVALGPPLMAWVWLAWREWGRRPWTMAPPVGVATRLMEARSGH